MMRKKDDRREGAEKGWERDLALDRAYRATTYVADVRGQRVSIRIGESGAEACMALGLEDGEAWAYLTAWNPGSEDRPQGENEAAQERLREALRADSHSFFEGMSEPDDGRPGEASLLVAIPEDRAVELGRAFGQNAIVVGACGRGHLQDEARLVWL